MSNGVAMGVGRGRDNPPWILKFDIFTSKLAQKKVVFSLSEWVK